MAGMTAQLRTVMGGAFDKIRSGELRTLIPFLSLFRLNGQPMNLKYHYQLAPLYNTVQPAHSVFMCARQLGKSYAISSSMELRSMLVPYYHTLVVQPRSEQIKRLINTVYRPILSSSPIWEEFITSNELGKTFLREFKNHSLCYGGFCFMSPDSLRGLSGLASLYLDEVQDIEYEFIPIIAETMSASLHWGFSVYTGTPKTTDTTLALLWNKSSQAEWVIRCTHCNYFNIPNPEHDLLKMIGKDGPICAKCGKAIHPHNGGYVHAIPEKALTFPGYHISQTIHPLHTEHHNKWVNLLEKVSTYSKLALYNEVLGWPWDASTSPLTLSDLRKATHDHPVVSSPSELHNLRKVYRYITVGVDWGGGGAISDSYTAYAVMGLRSDSDVVDVLYGKRMPKDMDLSDEADEILHWIHGVGADAFAYDNGGAGFARLEIMKQRGLMAGDGLTIVPINYVAPRAGDVMRPHAGQRESDLYYYSLDKSRSLAICITSIKSCKIRFPKFNDEDPKECVRDFLALREDPSKSARNETVILIIKKPGVPDDFAHAVNFGVSQIWDHFGAYPRIGSRYDTSILDMDEHGNIVDQDYSGPRGDFDRFVDAVNARADYIETQGYLDEY